MYGDYEALNYGWNSEAIEGMTGYDVFLARIKFLIVLQRNIEYYLCQGYP
jgi:hypothetical protein